MRVRLYEVRRDRETKEITGLDYDLLGFADVIDVKADEVVPDIGGDISDEAKKLLPPKP